MVLYWPETQPLGKALLAGACVLGTSKAAIHDGVGAAVAWPVAISGTVLVVTVLLDILLIPWLGAVGAAVASSVAYAMSFLLSVVLYGMLFVSPRRPRVAEEAVSSPP